jgi:hypothetical protein
LVTKIETVSSKKQSFFVLYIFTTFVPTNNNTKKHV